MKSTIDLFRETTLEMSKNFSEASSTIVKTFAEERIESRRMFHELMTMSQEHLIDLADSSEQRLDRANHMMENLSQLEQVIAHEYTDHIKKLRSDVDELKKITTSQQEYIRNLQDKVDERDQHIKDLLAQIATQNKTISMLVDKALNSQPLMYNNMAPTK